MCGPSSPASRAQRCHVRHPPRAVSPLAADDRRSACHRTTTSCFVAPARRGAHLPHPRRRPIGRTAAPRPSACGGGAGAVLTRSCVCGRTAWAGGPGPSAADSALPGRELPHALNLAGLPAQDIPARRDLQLQQGGEEDPGDPLSAASPPSRTWSLTDRWHLAVLAERSDRTARAPPTVKGTRRLAVGLRPRVEPRPSIGFRIRPPATSTASTPCSTAPAGPGASGRAGERARQPAVALTDHGNLGGLIEFYAPPEAGVKPILGLELYVGQRPSRSRRQGALHPPHPAGPRRGGLPQSRQALDRRLPRGLLLQAARRLGLLGPQRGAHPLTGCIAGEPGAAARG